MNCQWTRLLPREDGYYWWRADRNDPLPVILNVMFRSVLLASIEFDLFRHMVHGPVTLDIHEFEGGEWWGPIQLPSGTAQEAPEIQGRCYLKRLKNIDVLHVEK